MVGVDRVRCVLKGFIDMGGGVGGWVGGGG